MDGGLGGAGVFGDVLQGFEGAEVHGGLGVLRVAAEAVGFDHDRQRGLACLGLEGCGQALVGEQRGVDAAGEVAQVLKRGPECVFELCASCRK